LPDDLGLSPDVDGLLSIGVDDVGVLRGLNRFIWVMICSRNLSNVLSHFADILLFHFINEILFFAGYVSLRVNLIHYVNQLFSHFLLLNFRSIVELQDENVFYQIFSWYYLLLSKELLHILQAFRSNFEIWVVIAFKLFVFVILGRAAFRLWYQFFLIGINH
jgi:hypothetical protein